MAEYIPREALIAAIKNTKHHLNTGIARRNLTQNDIMRIIAEMPAADVDELATYLQSFASDKQQATNGDRIRAMSDEELAGFLCDLSYRSDAPWEMPFYRKFCDHCPAPEYTLDDGRKMCLHECDFKGGECPHGNDVVWWLQQPVNQER